MSAIQKELAAATKVDPKGMARPAFLDAVLVAVNKLSDAAWDALTPEAREWFNEATDIKNDNIKTPKSAKPIPDFPDYKDAADEPAPRRRSAAAEPEPEPPKASEEPEVGDNVTVTTRRGKMYTGDVIELPEGLIVVKVGDEELEFPTEGTEVFINEKAGDAQGAQDEPQGPADPQVGDTVALVTGRGKEYEGEVIEIDEDKDLIVLKVGKEELEFVRGTLKSVEVKGAEPEPEPEPAPRRRGAAAADPDPEPRSRRSSAAAAEPAKGEDDKQKRSSNPRGVSVGGRIRELLADDVSMTVEAVTKTLKDEGLAFRDTSVNMIYKDLTQFLGLLKAAKKLK